jgi:hypothetical protein
VSLESRVATRLALVTRALPGQPSRVARSLAIEEIYDDQHRLDPFLGTGEPVVLIKEGRAVAQLMPILPSGGGGTLDAARFGKPDFRARFLEMWGADAFQSQLAVSEDFARLRSGRMF